MLLVEMWGSKKSLSRVAGQPAGEIRVLPAPTQEKEGGLTNSIAERKLASFDDIWGKILDFRLHKFEVMSILKECALLQKSPIYNIKGKRLGD